MTTETKQITCDRWTYAVAYTHEDGELQLDDYSILVHRRAQPNDFPMPDEYDVESMVYDEVMKRLKSHWDYGSGLSPQLAIRFISHEVEACRVPDLDGPRWYLPFGLENRKLNDWIEN